MLSGSPAIQFWDLKMPKMALADCSGVGDAVIAKPPDVRRTMSPSAFEDNTPGATFLK
jgi:hypothetical protein